VAHESDAPARGGTWRRAVCHRRILARSRFEPAIFR